MSHPVKLPPGAVQVMMPAADPEEDEKKAREIFALMKKTGAPPLQPSLGSSSSASSDREIEIEIPPPEPVYVIGELMDGRKAYCSKSSCILVEGVGAVKLSEIIGAADKKGVKLSDLGIDVDSGAAVVGAADELKGPVFTEEVIEEEDEGKDKEVEEQPFRLEPDGAPRRGRFLERRIDKEQRVNGHISDFERSVINHPGVRQPLDATATICSGAGKVALKTKPKEVKVVCSLM